MSSCSIRNKKYDTAIDLNLLPKGKVTSWKYHGERNQLWIPQPGHGPPVPYTYYVQYQSVYDPSLFLAVDHLGLPTASESPSNWQFIYSDDRHFFRLYHVATGTYLTGSKSGKSIKLADGLGPLSDRQLWYSYNPASN